MPTKTKTVEIAVYEVISPFTLAGKTYESGDEFLLPQGWQETVDPVSGWPMFLEPYIQTWTDEKGKKQTGTFYRNHFLPLFYELARI